MRDPRVIGINESDAWNHADGLTANEKCRLVDALGSKYGACAKELVFMSPVFLAGAYGDRRVLESSTMSHQPCTWGMPPLKAVKAPAHAVAVRRLLDAGAILLGATNVPFQLMDVQAFNDIYGTSNKPLGSRANTGRIIGRRRGVVGCRDGVLQHRVRHRRQHSSAGGLLWHLRP